MLLLIDWGVLANHVEDMVNHSRRAVEQPRHRTRIGTHTSRASLLRNRSGRAARSRRRPGQRASRPESTGPGSPDQPLLLEPRSLSCATSGTRKARSFAAQELDRVGVHGLRVQDKFRRSVVQTHVSFRSERSTRGTRERETCACELPLLTAAADDLDAYLSRLSTTATTTDNCATFDRLLEANVAGLWHEFTSLPAPPPQAFTGPRCAGRGRRVPPASPSGRAHGMRSPLPRSPGAPMSRLTRLTLTRLTL